MNTYNTWDELLESDEFREGVIDCLTYRGEDEQSLRLPSFSFNNKWYDIADISEVVLDYSYSVNEPITDDAKRNNVEWDAWYMAQNIADDPMTLKIVRERIKLKNLATDF